MARAEKQHKTKLTKGEKRAAREQKYKERAEAAALVQHDHDTREKTKTKKSKSKDKNKDRNEDKEKTEPKAAITRSTTAIPPPVIPASPAKHACAGSKATVGTAAVVKPEVSTAADSASTAPVATTMPSVRPYRSATVVARPAIGDSGGRVSLFQNIGDQVTQNSLVAQHIEYLRGHSVVDLLNLVVQSIAVAEHGSRK
ncbi:transcription initiation factor TFIID subunit 3 [Microdochium nivale]|nr:transcription initiation factor TFIID subunit 3 [Microdochium nivale]